MKLAEKLYLLVKEQEKAHYEVTSIEMNHRLYARLRQEFLDLEMGECQEIPRQKKSYKEGKEFATDTKGKFKEGVKVLDITTTLGALIKLNPSMPDDKYGINHVYRGTEEERKKAVRQLARKIA